MKRPVFVIIQFVFFIPSFLASTPLVRPKIGLVLSGGGAKGLAHIPVLKCLDDLEIPVDFIAGTSAGGIIGALYAIGYSGHDIDQISRAIDWFDLFTDRPPRRMLPFFEKSTDGLYQLEFFFQRGIPRPPSGLIFGQKFLQLFSELTFPLPGDVDFDQLPIPFRCVAVDLISGQKVVLKRGSLIKAMRATMAVPTIFSPVEWDGLLLTDGGVLDNLPVDVVKEMGAEFVIAVDLGSPLLEKEELAAADRVLAQTLRIVEAEQKKKNQDQADILIVPDMKGLGSMDYFFPEKLARIIDRGEAAAREARPAFISLKEKYRLKREKKEKSPLIQRQKRFLLERVTVRGNDKLPTPFICHSLGLKQGQFVDEKVLNRRIMELYALGYFESIQSAVFPLDQDKLELDLTVKEVPREKLRVGLGYDDFRKLVVSGRTVLTNLPLPGMRLENGLELIGLTRFRSGLYFFPPMLGFPLYPFLEVQYQGIPTRLYNGQGNQIATYQMNSSTLRAGLGLLVEKEFNLELSYAVENMNIEAIQGAPFVDLMMKRKDHLETFNLTAKVDTLDSVWRPKKGFRLDVDYEGSYAFTGTSHPYQRFEVSLDVHTSLQPNHILRLYGFLGMSSGDLLFFKFFNAGHPRTFLGMGYDQLWGNKIKIVRADYYYKLTNFLYLTAAANLAFDFEQRWANVVYSPELLWGTGIGIHVPTPAGPIDLIYSLGSKSFLQPRVARSVLYFSLGAKF